MMTVNLSIKGVPESIAEGLRQRAQRNHRSLQGELMAIIEQAAAPAPASAGADEPAEPPRRAAARPGRGEVIARRGSKSVAEIAAELRAIFPEPVTGVPLAVDILRELRDSR